MKKIQINYINQGKFLNKLKKVCAGSLAGIITLLSCPGCKSNSNQTLSYTSTTSDISYSSTTKPSCTITNNSIVTTKPANPIIKPEATTPIVIDIKDDVFSNEGVSVYNSNFKISNDLTNKINKHIKNFGGDCSFIVVNLDDGMSFGYNVDKSFKAASTIKVALSLFAFKEMDKGNGSLDELKLYEEKFRSNGSGILKNKPSGTNYSLKDLFYYTLNYSDNVAYYMVHDRFYSNSYNDFLKELGCNRLYLNNRSIWGQIDARSMALVWQEIYKYKDQSENGEHLFNLLVNAEYNYIKQGMEKYQSAHKSGWTQTTTHDSGIVFADDDYIVVTLNNNNGNYSAKNQLLKISSCIEEVIDEYTIYKSNIKNKQKHLTK